MHLNARDRSATSKKRESDTEKESKEFTPFFFNLLPTQPKKFH